MLASGLPAELQRIAQATQVDAPTASIQPAFQSAHPSTSCKITIQSNNWNSRGEKLQFNMCKRTQRGRPACVAVQSARAASRIVLPPRSASKVSNTLFLYRFQPAMRNCLAVKGVNSNPVTAHRLVEVARRSRAAQRARRHRRQVKTNQALATLTDYKTGVQIPQALTLVGAHGQTELAALGQQRSRSA